MISEAPFSDSARGLGLAATGEVLLAQLVSADTVEVELNVQWKAAAGEPSQYAYGLTLQLLPPSGCTDDSAENCDSGVLVDDGSCEFDLEEGVATTCDGDANGDGQVGIVDLLDVLDSFGTYCD